MPFEKIRRLKVCTTRLTGTIEPRLSLWLKREPAPRLELVWLTHHAKARAYPLTEFATIDLSSKRNPATPYSLFDAVAGHYPYRNKHPNHAANEDYCDSLTCEYRYILASPIGISQRKEKFV